MQIMPVAQKKKKSDFINGEHLSAIINTHKQLYFWGYTTNQTDFSLTHFAVENNQLWKWKWKEELNETKK